MVTIIFYAILALGVVTLVTGVVHKYNGAIEQKVVATQRAEVAEKSALDQQVENSKLQIRQELLDKQTAARKGSDLKKADVERMISNALNNVYATSPEAKKWADTPVPADVLAGMRGESVSNIGSGQDGKGTAPEPVVSPNTSSSGTTTTNKRAITRLVSPFDKPTK